ncbi:MAG: hypothetical protein LKE37_09795 [Atopobiaceae bacterium]|nr:hypothetical protein [Atopobiaceae bacterium]
MAEENEKGKRAEAAESSSEQDVDVSPELISEHGDERVVGGIISAADQRALQEALAPQMTQLGSELVAKLNVGFCDRLSQSLVSPAVQEALDRQRELSEGIAQTIRQSLRVDVPDVSSLLPEVSIPRMDFSEYLPRIELPRWDEHFSESLKAISESFRPVFEEINSTLRNVDWSGTRDGAYAWGRHGWVIPDGMRLSDVRACPALLKEADECAERFLTRDVLDSLFASLRSDESLGDDVHEMLELFDTGHYKPCAMMACALIDGTLIRKDRPLEHPSNNRRNPWRASKHTIELYGIECAARAGFSVVVFENLRGCYEHFFSSANDFDPTVEGELNRNFLHHGMTSQPVSRLVCLKLMLLLDAITSWIR